MNLIAKIRILLKLKKPVEGLIKEVSKVKPGYKTTEFWLTILSNLTTIVGTLNGIIDAKTGAIIMAVLNGIYTVVRTFAKSSPVEIAEIK